MSKNSEAVKRWRNNTKKRIIESMGGKCVCCEYNKCLRSMDLHHLNPKIKEFGFGKLRANPGNWGKTVDELRKCVLVCNRCHGEIHDGITVVPINAQKFNEDFASYKDIEKAEDKEPCPICGKMKSKNSVTCSRACAGKSARKVDWDNVNLVELMKQKSLEHIGEELGVTSDAVRKRIKKLGIPLGKYDYVNRVRLEPS